MVTRLVVGKAVRMVLGIGMVVGFVASMAVRMVVWRSALALA